MSLNFAIRDDDTNFFTRFSEIESVYGDIWERVPVSLAVVPFQAGIPQKRIPHEFWNATQLSPVGENASLVQALRDAMGMGRIAVMQHGYSHGDADSAYEFRDCSDLARKAIEGRDYLTYVFGCLLKVFVPPHNSFSRIGFKAVVDAGLHIAGIPSFHPKVRRWRVSYLIPYLQYKRFAWHYRGRNLRYPWVLRFSDHQEVGCYGLVPGVTFETLRQGLDFNRSMQGVFCLATHYWELLERSELHHILHQFINYACSLPDIHPVTVGALFGGRCFS